MSRTVSPSETATARSARSAAEAPPGWHAAEGSKRPNAALAPLGRLLLRGRSPLSVATTPSRPRREGRTGIARAPRAASGLGAEEILAGTRPRPAKEGDDVDASPTLAEGPTATGPIARWRPAPALTAYAWKARKSGVKGCGQVTGRALPAVHCRPRTRARVAGKGPALQPHAPPTPFPHQHQAATPCGCCCARHLPPA